MILTQRLNIVVAPRISVTAPKEEPTADMVVFGCHGKDVTGKSHVGQWTLNSSVQASAVPGCNGKAPPAGMSVDQAKDRNSLVQVPVALGCNERLLPPWTYIDLTKVQELDSASISHPKMLEKGAACLDAHKSRWSIWGRLDDHTAKRDLGETLKDVWTSSPQS